MFMLGFQVALVVENPPANVGNIKRCGFNPWLGKIPWRRKWQLTPTFFLGNPTDRGYLVGYSPWGR